MTVLMQNVSKNSMEYWNMRFENDWDIDDGPSQSRFFARVAIEHFPVWLINQIKTDSLSMVDWGCAEGDGTDFLAWSFRADQLYGVDFSQIAIDRATKRYPALRFVADDWLAADESRSKRFDVVFSSNTLEHFDEPYEVLDVICSHAIKAVVLLLPYREIDRHGEHCYTFLAENIPLRLGNGFRLVWSNVVDCRLIDDSFWPGEQILLVYSDTQWMDSLNLTLSDMQICPVDSLSAVLERDGQISILDQEVKARDGQISILDQEVKARDGQIAGLKQELMSISDWAQKIDSHPLKFGLKKHGRKVMRSIYHILPLPTALKYRLKGRVLRTLGSIGRTRRLSSDQPLVSVKNPHPAWKKLEEGGKVERNDVIVFSVIDWHFRIQRPQHLARSFAKSGKRVFFFSNHFVDSSEPGYQTEKLDHALDIYQIKLHVKGAPAIYFGAPTQSARMQMEAGIARLMLDFAIVSTVSLIQHAYWYPVAKHLPNSIRVYDCMDHHEGFGGMPEPLVEIEKTMLRESELIVVTSSWLEDFARGYNENVAVVRNAGEYPHFSEEPTDLYKDPHGRRIIGYYGAIAEWFDIELVLDIALAHPDALVLLIGNDTIEAAKSLKDLSNVVFTGEVPYAKLPYYLYAFDVCLLPFKVIPLTLATNPVKVYEYLAAGKPVVCVDLPEIAQFENLALRARTKAEFVDMVSRVLASPESSLEKNERQSFASRQTWDHRIETLGKAIIDLPMPRISVVVLTYNNLELTKACLDSIERYTDYPNIELIVVDNASSDDSQIYLTELKKKNYEIKLIFNDKNLGFAAGNNVGLKAATGDYIVMLNNDTIVTPGWLMTLLRHLQTDSSIGIIGPVTNNIGNEAKIEINYPSTDQMLPYAASFTLGYMGKHFPVQTVAFFCAMMTRKVFEQVGLLDENFGQGFFEDDDYCRRVEQLGLRSACAEDVFVHHHLSASFNKLMSGERQALFDQNKTYYESKWGPWHPHEYRRRLG